MPPNPPELRSYGMVRSERTQSLSFISYWRYLKTMLLSAKNVQAIKILILMTNIYQASIVLSYDMPSLASQTYPPNQYCVVAEGSEVHLNFLLVVP